MILDLGRRNLCRPLRGLRFLGDAIPGLRSLRSLTRGYMLSPATPAR
jgi:hypothetical protein